MSDAEGRAAQAAPIVDDIAIIGMGLIGSSLARAVREAGLARRIRAADLDPATCEAVERLGIADTITTDLTDAVRGAGLVVIAAPVGAVEDVVRAIAGALAPGAVLSDVGSVKGAVLAAMRAHAPAHARLVPAHPVAGTEQSGPEAGFAALFHGRWCIVTPPDDADAEAVALVSALWRGVGSRVDTMSAEHHDRVLAVTSHLPHLIAYTIVGTASDLEAVTQSEVVKYSAGGFRDFTRIAASNPVMWRDVFLSNKDAVLELLGRFTEDLIALQRAIRWGEGETLFEHFERTRAIRRGVIEEGQDTPAPDFGRRPVRNPDEAEPDR